MRRFSRSRPLRGMGREPGAPPVPAGPRLRLRGGLRAWLGRLSLRLRVRRIWLRNLILAAAVLYLLIRIGDLLLMQPLKAVAEVEARRLGAAAVNRVVAAQVSKSLAGAQVVEYVRDESGRIAAYHVNTPLVNRVASEAAVAVQEELKRLAETPVRLPLGALTGSALLSNLGPRLSVQLVPVGSVSITVQQEFKGEGINQTRHRVWLEAAATMRIILPLTTQEVPLVQELPLADTVIVGPVPNALYGGSLGGVTLPAGR